MTLKFLSSKVLHVVLWSSFLVIASCSGGGQADHDEMPEDEDTIDSTESTILQVGNQLFNVPSPVEMAMLIKEAEGSYNDEWLLDVGDVSNYSTKFQQALILGVYSADLGYTLSFGESNSALGYLGACRKLGTELSIPQQYYMDLFQRFEGNMGNPDSLTIFMAQAFQISDAYLKANESEDISTLILTGGYIESLYYAAQVARGESNEKVRQRIGEQSGALDNILQLMLVYKDNPEFAKLIKEMKELKKLFKDVEYSYEYVEPTIDTVNQVTIINSVSETKITDEQINAIMDKVEAIRKAIIG